MRTDVFEPYTGMTTLIDRRQLVPYHPVNEDPTMNLILNVGTFLEDLHVETNPPLVLGSKYWIIPIPYMKEPQMVWVVRVSGLRGGVVRFYHSPYRQDSFGMDYPLLSYPAEKRLRYIGPSSVCLRYGKVYTVKTWQPESVLGGLRLKFTWHAASILGNEHPVSLRPEHCCDWPDFIKNAHHEHGFVERLDGEKLTFPPDWERCWVSGCYLIDPMARWGTDADFLLKNSSAWTQGPRSGMPESAEIQPAGDNWHRRIRIWTNS